MSLNFANNNSLSAITTKPSGLSGGALNLISTQTASSSSTISFTSGIDSTYDEYVFKFYDIHPATDGVYLNFQASTNGGSSYGVTLTSTFFRALHNEADDSTNLEYRTARDLAQSTSFQNLTEATGNDNDQSCSGTLTLFNPSSTTFVKHWLSTNNTYHNNDFSMNVNSAGYFNTTSAINAVQFKMSSGNIDSGVIKLYGVS
jgi:hypothetical protein